MPAAAVAAASTVATAALGTIGTEATLASIFTTNLFLEAGFAAGMALLGQALSKPEIPSAAPFTTDAVNRTQTIRSSIAPRRVVFGESMVSGPIVYAQSSGSSNEYLHLVIALAGHQCESIGDIYFDDQLVGTLDASGNVTSGRYSQAVSTDYTEKLSVNSSHQATVARTVSATRNVVITYWQQHLTYDEDMGWIDGYTSVNGTLVSGTPSQPKEYSVSGSTYTFYSGGTYRDVAITYAVASTNSYTRIKKHLGASDQTADTDLMADVPSEWTSAHRLRGICYIYVRLTWSPDIFPTGLPQAIKAVIKGKNDIFDPRDSSTGWTCNAALCQLDYLRWGKGLAIDDDEYDSDSWVAAANVCDESVTISGGSQSRYELNGTFTLDAAPIDTLDDMRTASAGAIVWSGGKWYGHAGAAITPQTVGLTADDLRDSVKVRPRPARQVLFNAVSGTYVNPGDFWQPTSYPPVTNSTYETQDGGEQILKDLALPYTTDAIMAQRLAKITLERSRQGITVQFPANLNALRLRIWDVVPVSIDLLGWDAKNFIVVGWTLTGDLGIDLQLQEYASTVWDWDMGDATTVDAAPDTQLPDPFTVAAPSGVTADSGTAELFISSDGTITSRIKLAWNAVTDQFVNPGGKIEIQWKRSDAADWTQFQSVGGGETSAYLANVQDGVHYDIRLRSENSLGVRSTWTSIYGHVVIGKSAPPSDVPWFAIAGNRFTWGGISDIDKAGYKILFNYGDDRSWEGAAPLHTGLLAASPYDVVVMPSGTVTFLVKAVDTSGNVSTNAAVIVSDLGDPLVANVVQTFDLVSLGFPGTITGGAVDDDGNLAATETTQFYPTDAGRPDDWPWWWPWHGETRFYNASLSSDFYPAANYEALTYESDWIEPSLAGSGSNMTLAYTTAGDKLLQYHTDSTLPFYGAVTADKFYGSSSAAFYAPAPDFAAWPGLMRAGNMRYKFQVSIGAGPTQGKISALKLTVDLPDLRETLGNVAIAATGTRLPITKTYDTIVVVNLTVLGDGGDAVTARVIDRDTSGPQVKCYDSTGTAVAGSVDAIIEGY